MRCSFCTFGFSSPSELALSPEELFLEPFLSEDFFVVDLLGDSEADESFLLVDVLGEAGVCLSDGESA